MSTAGLVPSRNDFLGICKRCDYVRPLDAFVHTEAETRGVGYENEIEVKVTIRCPQCLHEVEPTP